MDTHQIMCYVFFDQYFGMSLTLKEKIQLYKVAKKPRKQIRLKFQVITNGIYLPKVQHCEYRYKSAFKIHQVAKIEPQINVCAQKYKNRTNMVTVQNNENLELLKARNKLNCLKVSNQIGNRRLELNLALKEISKNIDDRSDEIMRHHSDFQCSQGSAYFRFL